MKNNENNNLDIKARFWDHALIHDPIHDAVEITVAHQPGEVAERDIIESPWMQRLRRIHQLQSTWWIFPSAEHTRFQHSVGVMHLAGLFARHFYPYLRQVHPECPSAAHVEELMRLAGLLHDVGHGPFCHYLDEEYLQPRHELNHEKIGQRIIVEKLGEMIKGLRRAPGGGFDEQIDPNQVAYLLVKHDDGKDTPAWLRMLKMFFAGLLTVDNIDYVMRDAYWCGIPAGALSIPRFLHYSYLNENGLVLHTRALSSLQIFLNARFYLYTNVYYHRDVRAIDLQMRSIFEPTMDHILGEKNKEFNLDKYFLLTEWSLMSDVTAWAKEQKGKLKELGRRWEQIFNHQIEWQCVAEEPVSYRELAPGVSLRRAEEVQEALLRSIPKEMRSLEFLVDSPQQNPRPGNPFEDRDRMISVYDPHTRHISNQRLSSVYDLIPAIYVLFRVYRRGTVGKDEGEIFSSALKQSLGNTTQTYTTNI